MSTHIPTESDLVERFSRRSLWVGLVIVLCLGGFAVLSLAAPSRGGWRDAMAWAAGLVPMVIGIAVVVLGRAPGSPRAMASLQADEWHRRSVGLAQRDALIAVLVAQPVCAVVLTHAGLDSPAALMACLSVTLGGVVLLASVLWRDR